MTGTRDQGGRANRWRPAAAALACAAVSLVHAGHSTAQDTAPRLPFGSAAVVLPVQSALPTPGGSWPGHAATEEASLRAMDAELAFALAERRAARDWALPENLRRRVARNPTLAVDPDRVAYQGLLQEPDRREQIYEPLHGELRTLAALSGTRFVVLPLRLRLAPAAEMADAAGSPATASDALDVPAACAEGASRRRPELLLALIDIRRSLVLWHGTVQGRPGCPESGGLLAELAATVALQLTES